MSVLNLDLFTVKTSTVPQGGRGEMGGGKMRTTTNPTVYRDQESETFCVNVMNDIVIRRPQGSALKAPPSN